MHARCLCGDVAWEVEGPLDFGSHCHCTFCRKSHGAGYASAGAVPVGRFRFTAGAEKIARFESTPGAFRCFCARCGSPTPGAPHDGQMFVPLGPLEGDVEVRILAHIFAARKAPWLELGDGLPRFDAWPPGFELPVGDDLVRAPASGPGKIRGSCLCDAIAWEVDGPLRSMRHCHCLRCRRAHAAAHASNGFAEPGAFRFTRGEEHAVHFRVPEAKRFTTAFCPDCGAKVPCRIEALGVIKVPLGCLDDDPGGQPVEHIFVGSKAPWLDIADPLPRHREYGPPSGS